MTADVSAAAGTPADEAADVAPAPARSARDFRLFWLAGAASDLGSHASGLVLPLLVLGLGGSATTAGLLGTAAGLVQFGLAPVFGVYADRWPRRTMMALAALVAAAAIGLITVGVWTGWLTLPALFAAGLVEGAAAAAFTAASSGSLRRLLPPDAPEKGLAALRAREQGAQLAGPTVGGALFQLVAWAPFLLDAISYAVAAVCVRAIGSDLRPERSGPTAPAAPLREFRAGLAYLWQQPFLRFLALWSAGVNVAFGVLYFHVVLSARLAGRSASAIGLVLTVAAAGGLLGALLAPRVLGVVKARYVVLAASWLMAVLVVPLALTTLPWLDALLLGGVFLLAPALSIVFQSKAIMSIPDELQGRVGSALGAVGEGAGVVAPLTAGLLTAAHHGALAVVFGIALTLLAVYATVNVRLLKASA